MLTNDLLSAQHWKVTSLAYSGLCLHRALYVQLSNTQTHRRYSRNNCVLLDEVLWNINQVQATYCSRS